VSVVGRNTMGVTVMDVAEDDAVAAVDVVPAENVGDDEIEAVETEAEE